MRLVALTIVLAALSSGAHATEHAARTGHATEISGEIDRVGIPAGWFSFGASTDDQNVALELCRRGLKSMGKICSIDLFSIEGPQRSVFLPGFSIDHYEVTVGAYRSCMRAGRCDPRPLLDADPRLTDAKLPITRVSWFDAQAYCHFVGAELPSELQWERAARGSSPRIFPWGDAPHDNVSNHGEFVILDSGTAFQYPVVRVDDHDGFALLAPPGSFPSGASPDGVMDMAGNAMEWVQDPVGDEGQIRTGGTTVPSGVRRMIRGGSYRQPLLYQRTTAWEAAPPEIRSPEIGFRCAK